MMKKKALTLVVLLCTFVLGAWAQEPQAPQVKYIERSWDDNQKKIVETEKTLTGSDYELLEGTKDPDAWALLGSENDTNDHYYVVLGHVTYKVLNVYGRAHIILCNNAQLTCTGGILVEEQHNNAQLFIYGQSGDTGKLIVNNTEYKAMAGIGSSATQKCGEITIHGGYLDVKGGKWAAGIGGGGFTVKVNADTSGTLTNGADGTTTIFGGTVIAQGGELGAGIGAGGLAKGGTLKIYGGDVTATGGDLAAGVGGGGSYSMYSSNKSGKKGGLGSNVDVYGGKLTAQGGGYAAGIGTGCVGDGRDHWGLHPAADRGVLNVYEGATVIATGGKYGAGIGGGWYADGIKTYIYGGTVTATGGEDGAGIGSGESAEYTENTYDRNARGGETHISGGVVTARGKSYGAGIGGGEYSFDGDTYITGGTVIAIAGEDCKGREDGGGSAIGRGQGMPSKIADKTAPKFEIGDNMMVTGGDAENNIERVFTADERDPACRWRNYVKIEPCSHETPTVGSDQNKAITYTIVDDLHHIKHCRYCKYTVQEEHSKTLCDCGRASFGDFTIYYPGTEKDTYVKGETVLVGFDKDFYLPACTDVPTGYKFLGWEMNPDPEDNKWEAKLGEDIKEVGATVAFVLAMDEAKFYPRFLYDYQDEWTWNDDYTKCTLILSCDALPNSTYQVVLTQNDAIVREYLNDCVEYSISYTYNKNGYDYKFSTRKRVPYELTLQDDADNSAAIGQYAGKTVTATLTGRTLYRDGTWNTLCLPFDVTIENSPLEGAVACPLSAASISGTTLNLTFGDAVTTLAAGTPYMIKWEKADGYDTASEDIRDIKNPVFEEVTVNKELQNAAIPTDGGGTKTVTFLGTYQQKTFTADDKNICLLGDDSMPYYPTGEVTIGAQRGYFLLTGLTAGDDTDPASIRSFVLNLGDDEKIVLLKGDANGDEKVDAADIVEMVNAKKDQPSEKFNMRNADITGDGDITDADITEVTKIIMTKD